MRMPRLTSIFCAIAIALGAVAHAADLHIAAPEVPAALQPPSGQVAFLEAHAKGVQIYECTAKADAPPSFEWKLSGPEATLADAAGKPIGKHYAGPTWAANDGSSVVGEVKARDQGPDSKAVPWLLLSAKETHGSGLLSATRSVQRIHTVGGVAPAQACDAAHVKQVVRSDYSATYYFYRDGR